jgi:hypothetical protein
MSGRRILCILATVSLCAGYAAASTAQVHVETTQGFTSAPISNAAIDSRLVAGAAQYRRFAPIPRLALYDIVLPRDSAEAAGLGGNAVLVVTALVQDSSELPLKRVYVATPSGTLELASEGAVVSYVTDTLVRTTFGRFRMDAVFLLPLRARAAAGDLLADFSAHRQAFRLAQFASVPESLTRLGQLPAASPPPSATLWAFIRREYPDLAPALAPR